MSVIKKGTVMVWCQNDTGEVEEYFVVTKDFDTNGCYSFPSGKFRIRNAWGFRIASNAFYSLGGWTVDRVATEEERQFFYNWMEIKGHKFNKNTLNIIRF